MSKLQLLRKQLALNKELHQTPTVDHKPQTKRAARQWGLYSHQRTILPKEQIITNNNNDNEVPADPLDIVYMNMLKINKNWQFCPKNKFIAKIMNKDMYYPPNCSGYDMTYCKYNDSIYIYGGISCSSSLNQGIKPYFYRFSKDRWTQIKPESFFIPSARYGHTITSYQKDLILIGGVSQYKEKLKDRCFYGDFSCYSTVKNQWKMIQSTGLYVKTRKNHTACMYNKFYIIYGGLNESQQTINQINWISMNSSDGSGGYKKSNWKNYKIQGRFNHKMLVIEPQSGRDFLCIFGGRNSNSEITNSLFYIPLTIYNNQLELKEPIVINHNIQPRQFPIMTSLHQGFLILGGINENSDMVEDCWYYNSERQIIEEVQLDLEMRDLRGAKGCNLGQKIYVFAGSNLNYKAVSIELEK